MFVEWYKNNTRKIIRVQRNIWFIRKFYIIILSWEDIPLPPKKNQGRRKPKEQKNGRKRKWNSFKSKLQNKIEITLQLKNSKSNLSNKKNKRKMEMWRSKREKKWKEIISWRKEQGSMFLWIRSTMDKENTGINSKHCSKDI